MLFWQKKYDKYDVEKQKDLNLADDDAFARLYAFVEADIEAATQKADTASKEKSRASAVAMNAEIRRTKALNCGPKAPETGFEGGLFLFSLANSVGSNAVPKLQRLALKGVKGLSTEDLAARNNLPDRIHKPSQMELPLLPPKNIWGVGHHQLLAMKSNLTQRWKVDDEYFQQTEESSELGKSMKCGK